MRILLRMGLFALLLPVLQGPTSPAHSSFMNRTPFSYSHSDVTHTTFNITSVESRGEGDVESVYGPTAYSAIKATMVCIIVLKFGTFGLLGYHLFSRPLITPPV